MANSREIKTTKQHLEELKSMDKETLIGMILHLEFKQHNSDIIAAQKARVNQAILAAKDQRIQAYKLFKTRNAQMHSIPETKAGHYVEDQKALERTSIAEEEAKQQSPKSPINELLKKATDDFNAEVENFQKKKAEKHSQTITISRPSSRLSRRGT